MITLLKYPQRCCAEITAGASSPRVAFAEIRDGAVLGLERLFKF